MNTESQFHHYISLESPSPPHYHFNNNGYHHTYPPNDPSFLGPLHPLHDQAIHNFNAWNRSTRGCFPSQLLQGPGQTSAPPPSPSGRPLSTASCKRKRATSPGPAVVGGYGPIPGGLDEESEQSTPGPPPAIKFTERKNSAYDVWAFLRAIEADEVIPDDQWPDDYNRHLVRRPKSQFVSCKLCSQFG